MNNLSPATPAGNALASDDACRAQAHQWFSVLDQRLLSVGSERWLTQVLGIHEDGSDVWIQVQPLREQLRDFTIRVQPGMTVDEVVAAVEKLIRDAAWSGRQPHR